MTDYVIVPASILHVRPMAKKMRMAGAIALQAYGFNPREGLRRILTSSHYARTALIEGKPVAMWGLAGPLLSDTAYAWLVLAEEIRSLPRDILEVAKAELAEAARTCPTILATVLPDDEASLRFALHLGFRGADGERDVLDNPKYRVQYGDASVVQLTFQPGA